MKQIRYGLKELINLHFLDTLMVDDVCHLPATVNVAGGVHTGCSQLLIRVNLGGKF